jgi:hypothetical protein
MPGNGLQDHGSLFQHLPVLETRKANALGDEEGGSLLLVFISPGVLMHGAIDFDPQLFFGAIEIEDIGTDAVLSPELPSVQGASAQTFSQQGFSERSLAT